MEVTNLLDIHTREEYAQHLLSKFVCDCHSGKHQSGWSDFGRLG